MEKADAGRGVLLAVWVAATLSGPAAAQKDRILCWTEENGHRACGDQVPARYAKVEREVFNERGIVIEKFPREPTAAEQAAVSERARAAEEVNRKERDQAAYDRYLFESYGTLKDLEAMRDSRLAVLDGRLGLAAKSVVADEAAQKSLQERLDTLKESGKEPSAPLLNQQKTIEASLAGNRKAMEQLKAEREKTQAQFARDIARYQELRGAGSASSSP